MINEPSTNPHVLIAHSDPRLRNSYSESLSCGGYLVTTSTDGLACLKMLRGIAPDVLVLERKLPWGGAESVLARLREDAALPRIPVVILLGDSELGNPLSPMAGLQCHERQLSPKQLARRIHQLIGALDPDKRGAILAS